MERALSGVSTEYIITHPSAAASTQKTRSNKTRTETSKIYQKSMTHSFMYLVTVAHIERDKNDFLPPSCSDYETAVLKCTMSIVLHPHLNISSKLGSRSDEMGDYI